MATVRRAVNVVRAVVFGLFALAVSVGLLVTGYIIGTTAQLVP